MKQEIIKLRLQGCNYKEIAGILGCAKSTISYHCKSLNIPWKTADEKIAEATCLYTELGSIVKVAAQTGLAVQTVSKFVGGASTTKVIDETGKEKLQELYDQLGSAQKVADALGVSKTTILKKVVSKPKVKNLLNRKAQVVKNVISWRQRKKVELVEYKGGKCEHCGYNKSVRALTFHHLDPTKKDFAISGKSWSMDKLTKEVDKCIMLCANCHAEEHERLDLIQYE